MTKNPFLKTILLSTVFGLMAGLAGQLFATAYLLPRETFILGGGNRMGRLANQTDEKEKIAEALKTVGPTVFEIYSQKTLARDPLGQIYLSRDRLALGAVLTSDGWLVSFGKNLVDPKNRLVVATSEQKIYSPQKIIFDETTGAVFLKIDAQNLPVPRLGNSKNLAAGEKIFIPLGKQSIKISQIENLFYEENVEPKNLFKPSEKISKFIFLENLLEENEAGAPIVNLDGEIIGLATDQKNLAAPIDFWQTAFFSLLKNDKIKRPYLGVQYIDLARAPGLSEAIRQDRQTGALLWNDNNLQIKAIAKNSPAAKAGLQSGDIILKVDTNGITDKINLAEIIQEYSPGDKVELTILRSGEEKTVEATLGEKL